MACIAEIVSGFDVLALQKVRRNTTVLQYLLGLLGTSWRFNTSDVTEGATGNGERLSYLYDTTRVQPSGLVGEIVLPPATGTPVPQFARTPYAAGFTRGTAGFVLMTVHVLWGTRAHPTLLRPDRLVLRTRRNPHTQNPHLHRTRRAHRFPPPHPHRTHQTRNILADLGSLPTLD
ncbi:hypothetical protein IWX65_003288, partial [Arthrobacter sp. CAN_A214]